MKTCARPYLIYDKYGRVIQTQSNNSLGGTDISHTEYDFPGKVLKTKTVHQTSAGTVTVKKRFDYDHTGRLVKTYQQNNTDSEIMLAQNTYNELGTLIDKKLHSTNGGTSALQTVNYTYNIRGWLTKVNDPTNLNGDLFAMELKYESVDANIAGTAQYNGNISQQIWATSTTVRHAYGYSYDALNQLSSAAYEKYSGSWNQDAGRFTESATYDLNGNIMTMVRGGKTGASSYGSMDNITMSYAGNKLIGANDAVTGITGNYQYHEAMVSSVVEGNTSTHEYLYDVNGNMKEDKNKGITVVYNYLNLPIQVNFGPNDRIDWTYTATGAKLQKKVYTNGSLTLTQDYVSGFVYKNGSLDFFSTESGRVKNQSGTLKYQYTLTDHLGNTRVMFEETSGTPTVIEESHYYAFGMRIEGLSTSSPDNKFTYNGKELEDDHGLNWYHYGARYYDAQIGRWHVVDPALEFHSPYTYVANNPIRLNDLDGTQSNDPTIKFQFTRADVKPETRPSILWYAKIQPGNDYKEFNNYLIPGRDGKMENLGDLLRAMHASVNSDEAKDLGDGMYVLKSEIVATSFEEYGLSINFRDQKISLEIPNDAIITTGSEGLRGGVLFVETLDLVKLPKNSQLTIKEPEPRDNWDRFIEDLGSLVDIFDTAEEIK